MTQKELSQVYYLNREIEQDKQRLRELECAAMSTVGRLSGMPHGRGKTDKTSIAVEIAYLRGITEAKIQQMYYEYHRLIDYINGIDDSLTRQILTLRHINGLTWNQVAESIGGGNNENSVKQTYHRFIVKSCHTCHDDT